MAKFGKLKRLMKKGPSSPSPRNTKLQKEQQPEEDRNPTPSSTPTRTPVVLRPAAAADGAASTDATEMKKNLSGGGGGNAVAEANANPLLVGGQTGADDVLDGILQDLNIKVGQLAVDAEKSDTVSEYSGGSAKSVESSSSEETDDGDDDEDDDDIEETDSDETEGDAEGGNKKKKGKKNSIGDRVAAVVAAADEIRNKKKGPSRASPTKETIEMPPPAGRSSPATETSAQRGRNTPNTEPPEPKASRSREQLSAEGEGEVMVFKKKSAEGSKTSRTNSKESGSKAGTHQDAGTKSRGSKSSRVSGRPSMKSLRGRKSPITTFLPKTKHRSSTPQFSPEIDPPSSRDDDIGDARAGATKSFDTKDDDAHTKDTQEVSEEGTFDDGTLDEDQNTLEENTLESDGEEGVSLSDSASRNDGSTFDDGVSEESRMKAKKTVMNKDVIIHQPGGPSSLVVRAMYYTPLPASPEDIIIKVEASSVSFRDCLLRRGIGQDKAVFPFVPGCEVVGTISNIGKAARQEGYRVGDRVVGMTRRGGSNGYYAKLNTKSVSPIVGSEIDAADAVCLVDVYMTAYQALRVGKKDGTPITDANVLITDGFSPVGQAAVALAKLEGANVYVTTTESRQDEYMKSLGVKCLPLAPSKWLHKLKGKMDIVIDNTCFDSYDSSWKALNANGVLVCTGMTSIYSFQDHSSGGCGGCEALGDVRDYQARWASVKAKYMMSQTRFHDLCESFQKDPKKYQQELKYLCFLVESGSLKPKIAERVSIEEVPDAQRYLETGKANGTIVCLP